MESRDADRITSSKDTSIAWSRERNRPTVSTMFSLDILWNGEFLSLIAHWISLAMASSHAAFTAGVTLAVVIDPPETGAGGNRESPRDAVIRSVGMPSVSAAICVMVVYVPVPMSCVALLTST